jgi:hypothetical protein
MRPMAKLLALQPFYAAMGCRAALAMTGLLREMTGVDFFAHQEVTKPQYPVKVHP